MTKQSRATPCGCSTAPVAPTPVYGIKVTTARPKQGFRMVLTLPAHFEIGICGAWPRRSNSTGFFALCKYNGRSVSTLLYRHTDKNDNVPLVALVRVSADLCQRPRLENAHPCIIERAEKKPQKTIKTLRRASDEIPTNSAIYQKFSDLITQFVIFPLKYLPSIQHADMQFAIASDFQRAKKITVNYASKSSIHTGTH